MSFTLLFGLEITTLFSISGVFSSSLIPLRGLETSGKSGSLPAAVWSFSTEKLDASSSERDESSIKPPLLSLGSPTLIISIAWTSKLRKL